MQDEPAICRAFDTATARLGKHGVTVASNSTFVLFSGAKAIGTPTTVDGLTAFADALDFAATR